MWVSTHIRKWNWVNKNVHCQPFYYTRKSLELQNLGSGLGGPKSWGECDGEEKVLLL
jgi:hypothetical protein